MTTLTRKLSALLRPERNRVWLYGVTEATLYAAAGFGAIDGEQLMLLLAVPAAILGVARKRVTNA